MQKKKASKAQVRPNVAMIVPVENNQRSSLHHPSQSFDVKSVPFETIQFFDGLKYR